MHKGAFSLFIIGLAFLFSGRCSAAVFSVVVDRMTPDYQRVVSIIQHEIGDSNILVVSEIDKADLADPIEKGRLLSKLSSAKLVVPIGNRATRFVLYELEDIPVFFVGASELNDSNLAAKNVSGILAYSPTDMIRLMREIIPDATHIGVIYPAGYSELVSRAEAEARRRGLNLIKRNILQKSEIGPAVRGMLTQSDVLWLPETEDIINGVACQFVLNEAMVRLTPVVAPSVEDVRKGALFCVVPDYEKMGSQIERTLKDYLEARPIPEEERIEFSPSVTRIAMNAHLVHRLKVTVPPDLKVTWVE